MRKLLLPALLALLASCSTSAPTQTLTPVNFSEVTIDDAFWGDRKSVV